MKKLVASILAGMMILASFASCASETDENTADGSNQKANNATVDIGVVLPTREEPRWQQDEAQFKRAIEASGKSVEVLFSQGDSQREKTNVETLVSKGIKVLILCPQDGEAAKDTAEYAASNGVKVISYDRLIKETEKVDYFCTFDSLEVGRKQAQFLVDQTTETGNNLFLYAGAKSDNNAFLFFQGAWEVLQPKIADGTFVVQNSSEAENLKNSNELTREEQAMIIGQVTTNWEERVAKSLAESNLVAVSDDAKKISYVLAPNDPGARAIGDVFRADAAVETLYITGQDAEKASIEYIMADKQSMTIFKDTNLLANEAMAIAIALYNEEEVTGITGSYNNGVKDVPAKQTEVVVVTKENAYEKLIASGYYNAEDIPWLTQ